MRMRDHNRKMQILSVIFRKKEVLKKLSLLKLVMKI